MQESTTSKEKILKKVRKALINKSNHNLPSVDLDSPLYTSTGEPLELVFAKSFSELNGKFVFCESKEDMVEDVAALIEEHGWKDVFCFDSALSSLMAKKLKTSNDRSQLANVNVGITNCECLVARTGSVMISAGLETGRRLPMFSNYHIVIAYTSQLVENIKDAFDVLRNKYNGNLPSMITNISGPSRTADIEKTLVQGAHGPKEIFVFLVDDPA